MVWYYESATSDFFCLDDLPGQFDQKSILPFRLCTGGKEYLCIMLMDCFNEYDGNVYGDPDRCETTAPASQNPAKIANILFSILTTILRGSSDQPVPQE
jgi:hypothetical protein